MESGLALDLRIASPETGRQTEPPRTPLARRMLWMVTLAPRWHGGISHWLFLRSFFWEILNPGKKERHPSRPARKGVLALGSLSTLGFARQASPVVPFVNSFRSPPILLFFILLPFSCWTAFPVEAFTGAFAHADSECFLMIIWNLSFVSIPHWIQGRARDSAWRFDLVFAWFPQVVRLGSREGSGSSRPRCRVVPKWLAIAAAVHLFHHPGIYLESLPSLPGIGFEPSIRYYKCRRIPGIWVFSINTIKYSFFLADSSLPSLLTWLPGFSSRLEGEGQGIRDSCFRLQ